MTVNLKQSQSINNSVPKHTLHLILNYLLQQQKTNNHISITPSLVFQYYKNFQLLSRLRGAALCLLKTNFCKKPVDHGLSCKKSAS